MKHNMRYLLIIPALLALLAVACGKRNSYITKVGMVWNTTYHITYCGPESLSDSITATLRRVGASVNVFDSLSTLSRINAGKTDVADAILSEVVACAVRINASTGGAFDPTLGPVIKAWGFGKGHVATSDTSHLDSLRRIVGLEKWRIEGGKVKRTDVRVELNLSGIAKGYGCDAVAAMFRRNGVSDYMVEIGGEIRLGGESPRGGKWGIAIDKPVVSDTVVHDFLTTVELTDCGLATSGNYRNFHTDSSGVRFGHTLDPRTLRPVKTDVLSATVIASDAMEADGYATACMVLGSDGVREMAEKHNIAVLIITGKGVWMSAAMKRYMAEGQDK